jgi:hypothetical protein
MLSTYVGQSYRKVSGLRVINKLVGNQIECDKRCLERECVFEREA